MGHYVWNLSFFDQKGDEMRIKSFQNKNFFLPIYFSSLMRSYYSPWSASGEIVCVHEVTKELVIQTKFYSLERKQFITSPITQVTSLICSPSSSEVLLIGFDPTIDNWRPYIVNFEGKIVVNLPFSNVPLNMFTSWLPDKKGFFLVNYDIKKEEYDLYYYNQIADHFTSKSSLNLLALVPYNKNDHKSRKPSQTPISTLKRNAFGKFLKEWTNIGFDIETRTLILRYVRPYGNSYFVDEEEYSYIQEYETRYRLEIDMEN
ncbi:MAG: hypothetical protein ACXACP_00020 [Candidatus Hodarchaeales archaeon]